ARVVVRQRRVERRDAREGGPGGALGDDVARGQEHEPELGPHRRPRTLEACELRRGAGRRCEDEQKRARHEAPGDAAPLQSRAMLPVLVLIALASQDAKKFPDPPAGLPPVSPLPDSLAASEAEMKPYRELVPGTGAAFDLVPIRGGTFRMGSPA